MKTRELIQQLQALIAKHPEAAEAPIVFEHAEEEFDSLAEGNTNIHRELGEVIKVEWKPTVETAWPFNACVDLQ